MVLRVLPHDFSVGRPFFDLKGVEDLEDVGGHAFFSHAVVAFEEVHAEVDELRAVAGGLRQIEREEGEGG